MDVYEGAKKIVERLNKAGYIAYFAGGWVRDYLLNHPSDDIDIATNATPETILSLFPHTIQVGISFGVVIVKMNHHQYEVATFRKDLGYTGGRRPDKIELSTPEEDAWRRDFTINGMFYDPLTETLLDFVGGKEDLKKGIIRTIGTPHDRFVEDRLRMVRAFRFAAKFDFEIEEETRSAILENAPTLFPSVAMERIWQEFNKMVKGPKFDQVLIDMHRLKILPIIFPALNSMPIEAIQSRVEFFNQFPENTPAIFYLLELFPDNPLNELLELSQYLRTSLQEGKLIELASKGKNLLWLDQESSHNAQKHDWAVFYANQYSDLCFNILTARYSQEKKSKVTQEHLQRKEKLLPHIQRMIHKKPLITSTILMDHGIKPGKTMGSLLKEAERLAINYDLHSSDEILNLLKESSLWPKN